MISSNYGNHFAANFPAITCNKFDNSDIETAKLNYIHCAQICAKRLILITFLIANPKLKLGWLVLTLSSMGSARLLFHGGGFKVPAA